MSKLTKEALAARLNGHEYGENEITREEQAEAKAAGLVVLIGGSDDLAEFYGAIREEGYCYGGGTLMLLDGALFKPCEGDCHHCTAANEEAEQHAAKIEAQWDEVKPYSWTYKTSIPHATFDVLEDGEKFCRGIVFKLSDAYVR